MTPRTLRFLQGLALLSVPACAAVEKVDRPDTATTLDASDDAGNDRTDTFVSADTTPLIDSGSPETATRCDTAGMDVGVEHRFDADAEIDAAEGGSCDLAAGVLGSVVPCPPGWTCAWTGCVERWPCERIACGSIYCAADTTYSGFPVCSVPGRCIYGAAGGAFPPPDLPSA